MAESSRASHKDIKSLASASVPDKLSLGLLLVDTVNLTGFPTPAGEAGALIFLGGFLCALWESMTDATFLMGEIARIWPKNCRALEAVVLPEVADDVVATLVAALALVIALTDELLSAYP